MIFSLQTDPLRWDEPCGSTGTGSHQPGQSERTGSGHDRAPAPPAHPMPCSAHRPRRKNRFLPVLLLTALTGRAPAESPDSLITACMDYYHIPAISACAIRGDSVAWLGAFGLARIEDSMPCTDTTVFDLASVSKTATAAALMQLWEAGRFGLDDDVGGFLPFPVRNPRFPDSAITFRQLLTHTSSIVDNWTVFSRLQRQGDPDVPLRAFAEGYLVPGGEYYDSSANFSALPPGSQYRYSNVGIALAGYCVEALTDSFHHYTRDSLFLPLGMTRTVWYFAGIDTNTMAMPYRWTGSQHVRYGHQSLPDVPAGTMKSSAPQLGRFLSMMLGFGRYRGTRILDSATVALMTTVQPPAGIGIVWHPGQVGPRYVWSHGGGWNGITTWIGFCPADSTAAVVLSNLGGAHCVGSVIAPALFDRAAGITEAPVSRPQSRMPGTLLRPGMELHLPEPAKLVDAAGRVRCRFGRGTASVPNLGAGAYILRFGTIAPRRVLLLLP
jgi:CubicO group peptidase (beta-lactamase class C family)